MNDNLLNWILAVGQNIPGLRAEQTHPGLVKLSVGTADPVDKIQNGVIEESREEAAGVFKKALLLLAEARCDSGHRFLPRVAGNERYAVGGKIVGTPELDGRRWTEVPR